jgi:uncharacterized protein (DUF4213/DUF364 family)
MWNLYDELIDGIGENLTVDQISCGTEWTMVRSGNKVGVAMTSVENLQLTNAFDDLTKLTLKELAKLSKSWDFLQAGIGVAAINAYYNAYETVDKYGFLNDDDGSACEAFSAYKSAVTGKKVAVIGHFPNLEQTISQVCTLSILERAPQPGDYPDPACEYILPEQDFVFITGVTLINKTLPRLLELSKNAQIVMVGPSVPITPILFKYGVYDLAGFVVKDNKACSEIVEGKSTQPLFYSGERIQFKNI